MQDASKPIWFHKEKNKSDFSILVSTPVHSEVSIHYTQSLLAFQQKCMVNGILVSFSLLKSSLVTQGRNLCVNAFMEESKKHAYTHMLFIDSDIEFSFDTIMKLVAAEKDVVAAPYPLKDLDWGKIANRIKHKNIQDGDTMSKQGFTWPLKLDGQNQITAINGVAEVSHAPTGCMLIKREVIEKMIKHFPQLEINQPTIVNGKETRKKNFYNLFDTLHDPETKRYFGEDFGFCKRWTEIGGKCHILVDNYITHVGEYCYTGRLMDDLDFKKD